MRKVVPLLLLAILTPSAHAADSGGSSGSTGSSGSAPAPVVATTPTPAASPSASKAAATPTPATPTPAATPTSALKTVTGELTKIRALIERKNFTVALADLKIADKDFPNNADINNLLGYSARKLGQYKPAATYYTKALKIDPKHLGAIEYQGELFVLTKKISAAKKNLAKLKTLCGVNCEEYLDLKKAIGKK